MVASQWQSVSYGDNSHYPVAKQNSTLASLPKRLGKKQSDKYKKTKTKRLLSIIDVLDIKAESNPLSSLDKKTLRDDNNKLNSLRRDEEAKWAQRAKVKHFQEGGNNTKYFH
jgi:hypothetical protein